MNKEQKLIASFIPTVESMIEKEKAHLAQLKSRRRFLFDKTLVDEFIERSEWHLEQ